MSDELKRPDLKRPDDLRLPDELVAFEAQLAGHVLASSQLSRDELLYRAGWAACEAKLSLLASPPLKGGARGGIPAAGTAAVAALAASLAVAVTLALQSASRPSLAEDGSRPNSPLAAGAPAAQRAPVAAPAATRDPLLAQLESLALRTPRGDRLPRFGELRAMSSLRGLDRWDRASFVFVSADSEAASPDAREPATASRLLEEYLPGGARRGGADAKSRTDVLQLLNPLSWGKDTI